MSTNTLTRATETAGSMPKLLMQFDAAEMEAMRRFGAAQDVIQQFHCDDTHPYFEDLEGAEFESVRALQDFYEARLRRFLPNVPDLIEWVFNHETFEQALATAAPEKGEIVG